MSQKSTQLINNAYHIDILYDSALKRTILLEKNGCLKNIAYVTTKSVGTYVQCRFSGWITNDTVYYLIRF